MNRYQSIFYIFILLFTINCGMAKDKSASTEFGKKVIDMFYDGKVDESYALYTEKAKQAFSKSEQQRIIEQIKKLGNYGSQSVVQWQTKTANSVPMYRIDYALKYPKFTQYVRMILTKERDTFKIVNIRFLTEDSYKKLKENEKTK